MAYQDELDAGRGTREVDAVLLIEGIPFAFSTRAGIVMDTTAVYLNGPTTLTTVNAIDPETVQFSGQQLDLDQLMVLPGTAEVSVRFGRQWDAYFNRRTLPRTRLVAAISASATSFDVEDATGITAGSLIYCGRECIEVGSVAGNTLSGCTRYRYSLPGSKLQSHSDGTWVQTTPNTLAGRRAEVWLHVAGQWRLERRMLLDGSPQHRGAAGAWGLAFQDIMGLMAQQIGVGLGELKVSRTATGYSVASPSRHLLVIYAASDFDWWPPAGAGLCVLLSKDGYTFAATVQDTDSGTGAISAEATPALFEFFNQTGITYQSGVGYSGFEARLVTRLDGAPMRDLLRVMTSTGGVGDNGVHDVLWGLTTDANTGTLAAGVEEKRVGAGISQDLIDFDSFESSLDDRAEGWCYWVTGETTLRDFAEDALRAARAYLCVRDGKFSLRKLSGTTNAAAVAAVIEDKHIKFDGDFVSVDDETEALHTMVFKCNADPVSGELLGTVSVRDARQYDAFKDSGKRAEPIESRGLVVDAPQRGRLPDVSAFAAGSYAGLQALFGKELHRRANGLRKYDALTLPFRFHTLQPGDLLQVTTQRLTDFAGGTLDAQVLEIISTAGWNLADGEVNLSAWESWATKPIAPSGVVSSWVGGGTQTITLVQNHRYGGGTTPANQFADGWIVRVLDKTATPPFSVVSGNLTIVSRTADTMVVTGTVGAFTPAAGDIVELGTYDNSSSLVENTQDGYAPREYAFQADANGRLGANNNPADKWG